MLQALLDRLKGAGQFVLANGVRTTIIHPKRDLSDSVIGSIPGLLRHAPSLWSVLRLLHD